MTAPTANRTYQQLRSHLAYLKLDAAAEALAPVTTLAQSLGGSRIVDSVSELLPATTSAARDVVDAARPPAG